MPFLLTLKLFLVPSLIGLVTLSARRWGPTIAGWLTGLPVVAGPILFFIAMEQGNHFASTAAGGTVSAVLAIIAFCIAYAWTAKRRGWIESLLIALTCYTLAVLVLNTASMPLYVTFISDIAVILAAPHLYPRITARRVAPSPSAADLPLRMAVGAVLVFLVTDFAANLGPRLSGVFAMFPIMTIVLAVFSHRSAGEEFAIDLFRGMMLGLYSFSIFFFVLALSLEIYGITIAFAVAATAALAVQMTSRRFLR
jgi:hypothetical protein